MRVARLRLADSALERVWDRGWAERPPLDPDELIRRAERRTGCEADADRCGWRQRLSLLCADLESTARLTALGRTIAHGQLVAALADRFRTHALWRHHPEIAEQPIAAPVIVVGQMRSGTTRVQRLLASDPRLAFTRFYESWNPVPLRPVRPRVDDRKLRGWAGLFTARLLNPDFDAIHPTGWNAPDEEIGFQSLSIFGSAFEVQWQVPGYCAAVEADDGLAVYGEFRRMLQTVAWLRRDDGTRPWILKVPQFSQDLPALLHAFPDARLVCVSRDCAQVIASSASLVRNQMAVQSDAVDPLWIGREWTRKVALREQRMRDARARASVPQVELAFEDVSRDWRGEIEKVYRMIGLPLTPPVLTRMRRYAGKSRAGSHMRHAYDPADFGLPAPAACQDGTGKGGIAGMPDRADESTRISSAA